MTFVDLTTATARLPGCSPSSRTESALISEVMVNGPFKVYVERSGKLTSEKGGGFCC